MQDLQGVMKTIDEKVAEQPEMPQLLELVGVIVNKSIKSGPQKQITETLRNYGHSLHDLGSKVAALEKGNYRDANTTSDYRKLCKIAHKLDSCYHKLEKEVQDSIHIVDCRISQLANKIVVLEGDLRKVNNGMEIKNLSSRALVTQRNLDCTSSILVIY